MKLSADSQNKLERFFREYLSDETFRLPLINFYAGKFTKFFTLFLKVHGITFGRNIFIQPNLITRDSENRQKLSLELAAHEIAHVLQYKNVGFIRFFREYLTNYWLNLKKQKDWNADARHEAYLEIPFEREARAIAAEFAEWTRNDDFTG